MNRVIGGWVSEADYHAFAARAKSLGISAGGLLSLVVVRSLRFDPKEILSDVSHSASKGQGRKRITGRPTDPLITEAFKAWSEKAGLKPNSAAAILLTAEARSGAVEKALRTVESS